MRHFEHIFGALSVTTEFFETERIRKIRLSGVWQIVLSVYVGF